MISASPSGRPDRPLSPIDLDVNAVATYAGTIEGFLLPGEGPFLMGLSEACTGRGAIVEIGSYCGKSTTWLAAGSKRGAHSRIYAVDHHEGSPEHRSDPRFSNTEARFRESIRGAGFEEIVTAIILTSEQAAAQWRGPIELLFIDGAHDYASVRADFDLWSPFVIPGGTIAFHDSRGYWPGVWQLVQESVFSSMRYCNFRFRMSITAATKASGPYPKRTLQDQLSIHLRRFEVWQQTRKSLRIWREGAVR